MPEYDSLFTLIEDHKQTMAWIALISAALFFGCLAIVPWLVVQIPHDYFVTDERPKTPFADRHPVVRWSGLIAKNLVGIILVLAGILMLVLPGQGILTILVGLLLLNFPGKHRLERRAVQIRPVLNSINWFRRRRGVAPIAVERNSGCDPAQDAKEFSAQPSLISETRQSAKNADR